MYCREEEEEEYDEQGLDYVDDEGLNVARSGLETVISGGSCEGALKMHHFNSQSQTDVRTLVLRRPRYGRLLPLRGRKVFNARVDGNCCWRITDRSLGNGNLQHLSRGSNGYPTVQPKSARKIPC